MHSARHKFGLAAKWRFGPKLIKLLIVEATKFRGQPAECPDQPELCGDDVHDEPELHLPRESEALLGFALNLGEGIDFLEKIAVQIAPAVCRIGEIAAPVGGLSKARRRSSPQP